MEKMKEKIKKFIPSFLIDWYHFSLSFLGAVLYWFPSKKIKIIGVTGTNGKSTTVDLITRILEEAGHGVASLSSIKFKIKEKEWPNELKMTMPGRFKIKQFLRQAVKSGCQYAVIEVASEGVKQHRHRFIDFQVAVFTNLTPEHIEAHGGFENYKKAKGSFFRSAKGVHIVNVDDKYADYFLSFPSDKKYAYGINGNPEDKKWEFIKAEEVSVSKNGACFTVKNIIFNLKLLGEFNIYNALAAICVGLSQGIGVETSKKALEKAEGVAGRMEEVISSPFKVFVDYAFTPNALEKAYQAIRDGFNPNKMICVLGSCGGGRDKWKRPVLGGIAEKYCDQVIVTNEDPYDENPMEIIDQVADGAKSKAEKILDRKEAINKALKSAKPNDVVIITGKGCEPWICLANGKKIPWDDRKTAREEFNKINI
ncbi:MAG: UDP-N-acetylmuramoyl-L-alanyl-D-glutamate--2,6-diaminopimelate ligase [Candidatus Nealsonbacteria bacterium]|nr:UDP-N-acetylmuramoyl-L-alanyl-D-glutamate--2,6-diaminopimelate ligase [Candidatus Nealsonbacteria bacterium]